MEPSNSSCLICLEKINLQSSSSPSTSTSNFSSRQEICGRFHTSVSKFFEMNKKLDINISPLNSLLDTDHELQMCCENCFVSLEQFCKNYEQLQSLHKELLQIIYGIFLRKTQSNKAHDDDNDVVNPAVDDFHFADDHDDDHVDNVEVQPQPDRLSSESQPEVAQPADLSQSHSSSSTRPKKKRPHPHSASNDKNRDDHLEVEGDAEPEPPKKSKRGRSKESQRKGSSPFVCGQCGSGFLQIKYLMIHTKKVHENPMRRYLTKYGKLDTFSKFHCPFCPVSYFLEESLQVHLEFQKIHHDRRFGSELRFLCDGPNGEGCTLDGGISHMTLRDLNVHLERDHPGAAIFKCSKCPWSFLHDNSRDFHETLHAGGTYGSMQMYQCHAPGCSLSFDTLVLLQRHFSLTHADNLRPFKCSKCSSSNTFPCMRDLRDHDRDVHGTVSIDGDADFVCEMCSRSFKVRKQLQIHRGKCRKKNRCDVCKEKFDDVKELVSHLKLSHFPGGRFLCPHCGKAFQLKESFRSHMKRHETSVTLLCPHCPKTFQNKSALKSHLEVAHCLETTGEERKKTKICSECGAAFFRGSDLNVHMKARHSSDVHQCPLCEKNFGLGAYLKAHIKQVHKLDWREVLGGN